MTSDEVPSVRWIEVTCVVTKQAIEKGKYTEEGATEILCELNRDWSQMMRDNWEWGKTKRAQTVCSSSSTLWACWVVVQVSCCCLGERDEAEFTTQSVGTCGSSALVLWCNSQQIIGRKPQISCSAATLAQAFLWRRQPREDKTGTEKVTGTYQF